MKCNDNLLNKPKKNQEKKYLPRCICLYKTAVDSAQKLNRNMNKRLTWTVDSSTPSTWTKNYFFRASAFCQRRTQPPPPPQTWPLWDSLETCGMFSWTGSVLGNSWVPPDREPGSSVAPSGATEGTRAKPGIITATPRSTSTGQQTYCENNAKTELSTIT